MKKIGWLVWPMWPSWLGWRAAEYAASGATIACACAAGMSDGGWYYLAWLALVVGFSALARYADGVCREQAYRTGRRDGFARCRELLSTPPAPGRRRSYKKLAEVLGREGE